MYLTVSSWTIQAVICVVILVYQAQKIHKKYSEAITKETELSYLTELIDNSLLVI